MSTNQSQIVVVSYSVTIHRLYEYDRVESEFSVSFDEEMLDDFPGLSEKIFRSAEQRTIKRWKDKISTTEDEEE